MRMKRLKAKCILCEADTRLTGMPASAVYFLALVASKYDGH